VNRTPLTGDHHSPPGGPPAVTIAVPTSGGDEQAELVGAIADTRAMFEAEGWE
jgi:hypothetical protein